jgi:hypothetical protein
MAHGMIEYEARIAPVKRQLFSELHMQCQELKRKADVLEVGIGAGPNISYYQSQVRAPSQLVVCA